jgi:hypothetical protein
MKSIFLLLLSLLLTLNLCLADTVGNNTFTVAGDSYTTLDPAQARVHDYLVGKTEDVLIYPIPEGREYFSFSFVFYDSGAVTALDSIHAKCRWIQDIRLSSLTEGSGWTTCYFDSAGALVSSLDPTSGYRYFVEPDSLKPTAGNYVELRIWHQGASTDTIPYSVYPAMKQGGR